MSELRHVLMTGYPGFVAKPLLRRVLSQASRARVTVIVEETRRADAEADLQRLGVSERKRVRLAIGDVRKMDLGLAGLEIDGLSDVTHLIHLAGIQSTDAPAALLDDVNVEGTRNALALAREFKQLKRFVHFSSCFVAGDRQGVILEDELDEVPATRTAYEGSKLRGERLARHAMAELPVTVIRPSIIVGDTRTGEVERLDGVYALAILIVTSPISVPLPLPGPGIAPLNLVPVDYLTQAVMHLTLDERAIGKVFHVVDPNPLAARHVYDLIATRAGKRPLPTMLAPTSLAGTLVSSLATAAARRVLRLPGIQRYARASQQAVELFDRFVVYNAANTAALLEGSGIRCPRFDTYVDNLVAYVTNSLRRSRRTPPGESDPFDG